MTMKSGKELNVRVAEEIMGHDVVMDEIFGNLERYIDEDGNSVYCSLRPYSEDILAAKIAVNKMIELGYGEAVFWKDDTRPEVICKAALSTVLKKKQQVNNKLRKSKLKIIS